MKTPLGKLVLLVVACLVAVALWATQPLGKDDVMLLLIGGATPEKMTALIEQRGIDFQMSGELEKQFRKDGATDAVIQALKKAGPKPAPSAAPSPAPAPPPPSGTTASSAAAQNSGQSSPAAGTPSRAGAAVPAQAAAPAAPSGLPPSGHASASGSSSLAGETQAATAPSAPANHAQATAPSAPSSGPVEQKIAAVLAELSSRPADRQEVREYPYAPMFSLRDLKGQKLDLHSYRGQVVMVDFWATWCGPCRSEIPEFVRLQDQYRSQGFRVIGISLDRSATPVRQFYQQYRMNYPVAICDSTTRQLYGGLQGVPTTVLIGRDGRMYASVVGAPADLGYFEDEIHRLLATPGGGPPGVQQVASKSPAPSASIAQSVAPMNAGNAPPAAGDVAKSVPASAVPPAPSPNPKSAPDLSDPSADQVQRIIDSFAAKERLFQEARDNYTYHQINKVQTLDADGGVTGEYEQDWDILYDDTGKRIERVTYAPQDTLKNIQITEQDIDAFRNIQPFVLTTEELPEYDVKYMGHVKVDELTAYVFSVRPKEIRKGRQYFQGVVWVDDRDLQIVKSEGKQVPELRMKRSNENLFPRFTTWREQIDGKFWFPTFTMADDTLYFSGGPVRIKEVIKYTDYKQFKSSVKTRVVGSVDQPQQQKNPPKK